MVFKEIEGYDNEFELIYDAQLGDKLIFVLHRSYNFEIEKFLRQHYSSAVVNSEVVIFEVIFHNALNVPKEFRQFVKQPYPIKLRGFKISRQHEYFEGFGPYIESIDSQTLFSVYYNGVKEEYDSGNVKIGIYKVRTPGYTDMKFRVIPRSSLLSRIEPRELGWNLIQMSPYVTEHHLQGGRLIGPIDVAKVPIMRAWLEACREEVVKKSDNQLIKILNRVKNGY